YLGLGLYSTTAIPAAFWLARARLGDRAAIAAAWLVAAEALMPRISTFALIEIAAAPPLLFGLLLADRALERGWLAGFAGGFLLGIGALLRFQAGLVCIAALGVAVAQGVRSRRFGGAIGIAAGLATAAIVEGALDRVMQGGWWASPIAYLR